MDDVSRELEFRHIVDQWADRRLGEMLDHVYFYTEPMEAAQRGERLDFSRVQRVEGQPEFQERRSVDQRAVRRLRQEVARRKMDLRRRPGERFTPPNYDEAYLAARRLMEEDDGY